MMESENICKTCKNRRIDIKSGLLCELTGMKPSFNDKCSNYIYGPKIKNEEKEETSEPKVPHVVNNQQDLLRTDIILNNEWLFKRRIRARFFSLLISFLIYGIVAFSAWAIFTGEEVLYSSENIFLLILSSVFLFIAIKISFESITSLISAKYDKTYKYLSRYGLVGDVEKDILSELRQGHIKFRYAHFTKHWIISTSLTDFDIVNYDDLVWCYKNKFKNYVEHVYINSTYRISLYDKAYREGWLSCKNTKESNIILNLIMGICPNILFGYNEYYSKVWKKSPQNFIDMGFKGIVSEEIKKKRKTP
jgi:hypothetical protein